MVGEEPAKPDSQLWKSVVKVAEATLDCLEPYEGIENKHVNDVISAVRNLLDYGKDFELMKNYKPPTTTTTDVTASSLNSQPAHDIRNQDYGEYDVDIIKSKKSFQSPAPPPSSPVVVAEVPQVAYDIKLDVSNHDGKEDNELKNIKSLSPSYLIYTVVVTKSSSSYSQPAHNRKHDDFNDYGSMSNFKFPTVDTTLFAATSTSIWTTPFSVSSPAINNASLSISRPVHNKNRYQHIQAAVYHNLERHWQQPDEYTVQINLNEGRGTITAIAITDDQQLDQVIQDINQASCIALNCEYLTQKKGGPPILKVLEIAVSKEKGFAIQVDLIGMQTITDKLKPILEDDQMTILAWSFRASAMAIEGYFKDICLIDVYDLQALLQDVTGENLNLGAAINQFASQWEGHDEFQRVKQQSSYQISFSGGKCVWDTTPLPTSALVYAVFKVLGLMALHESTMYYEATKKYYWPHTITSVASLDAVQRWMKERAVGISWQRDVMESQQREEEFNNHYQEEQSSRVYSGNHFHSTKDERAINNNIVDPTKHNKQELLKQQQYDAGQVYNHQQHEDEQILNPHQKEQSTERNEQEPKQQYDIEQVSDHQQIKSLSVNTNDHIAAKITNPQEQQVFNLHQQAENPHSWKSSSFSQTPTNITQQCNGNTETSTAARWNAFAAQCVNSIKAADNRTNNTQPSFKKQQNINNTNNLSGNSSPIDMPPNKQQQWSTGDVSSTRHINTSDAGSTYCPSSPPRTDAVSVGHASYYYTLLEQSNKH